MTEPIWPARHPIGPVPRLPPGTDVTYRHGNAAIKTGLVARVVHSAGYNLLSFTRAFAALVDTEGLPMRVMSTLPRSRIRDGAGLVLDKIRRRFPWLELIWADSGYNACLFRPAFQDMKIQQNQ